MDIRELDYELPAELIAQSGLADRSGSRLMVVDRGAGTIGHERFGRVADTLRAGDCLVLNDTKVVPARFFVRRATGGCVEGLFLSEDSEGKWVVMLKNAGRVKVGEGVRLIQAGTDELGKVGLKVIEKREEGHWVVEPEGGGGAYDILEEYGVTPLPPYIRREVGDDREAVDRGRYQTVYAREAGSAAAPTAGLHFTDELLEVVRSRGVHIAKLTLHVGVGTFKPVTAERLEDHVMHSERYELDEANAELINGTKANGGRIIAVGTTSVRTLETVAEGGRVCAGSGETDIFIRPGYAFKIVDGLITNFHLPRSTLLALVFAFGGMDLIKCAYRIAVEQRYRFYSYGDAMLIL